MAKPGTQVNVNIQSVPEALAMIRHELAAFTRRVAGAESDPNVARRLRQIAAAFEAGLTRVEP